MEIKRVVLYLVLILLMPFAALGQWNPSAAFPYNADGCCSFVIGGKAYVGGGDGVSGATNQFWQFDSTKKVWGQKAVIGQGRNRAWAFAFALNGKGYIGGGDTTGNFTVVSDFWEYDTTLNAWTQKADFPGGNRDGCATFVIGDTAYLAGGFNGTDIVSDFWKYDASKDQWTQIGTLPMGPNIFPSAFVINNKAYVGTGDGQTELIALWEYDPSTGNWTQKANFPGAARQAAVGFVVNGLGYIGGGQAQYDTTFVDVWSYNPTKDAWSKQADALPYSASAWSVSFVLGNNAYFGTGSLFLDTEVVVTDKFFTYSFSGNANSIMEPSVTALSLNVYPNPAHDVFHIVVQAKPSALSWLTLNDVAGKVVYSQSLQSNQAEISLSGLPAGAYFLRVNAGKAINGSASSQGVFANRIIIKE